MSGTAYTQDSVYNAAQEVYAESMHWIQHTESFGYNMAEFAQNYTMSGRRIVIGLTDCYVGSSRFVGTNPESFPPPGAFSSDVSYVSQCNELFNYQVDIEAQNRTEGAAFIDAQSATFEGIMRHRKLERERIFFSNGSGVLNRLPRHGGSTGADVTTPTSANWTAKVHIWDGPAFRKGMQVQAVSGTYTAAAWRSATALDTPSGQDYYTVGNVEYDPANSQAIVTLKEASPNINPPVDGCYFIVAGAMKFATDNNLGTEMIGIDGHINDGALFLASDNGPDTLAQGLHQGIDPTSKSYWKAPKATGSGWLKDSDFAVNALFHNLTSTGSSASQLGYFAHTTQELKYAQTQQGAVRVMVTTTAPSLPGGRESGLTREGEGPFLTYSGKPIMTSRFCDPRKVYNFNKDKGPKKFVLQAPTFYARHLDHGGRPAWQFDGSGSEAIGIFDRSACSYIDGLTVASGALA